MKPIIGIVGNPNRNPIEGLHMDEITYTPQGYIDAIFKVGGLPLIIPTNLDDVSKYLDLVDGLLLTGGQDISPELYGQEPHPKLQELNPPRDEMEMALIKDANSRNMPILGICRGLQILNVAFGGTLYQDLSEYPDWKVRHLQDPTLPEYATHSISIEPNSYLSEVYGQNYRVNTYHHQAINQLGESLVAIAESPDGLVEGLVSDDNRILAVQWHPEMSFTRNQSDLAIFKWLINKIEK
ncbi:gamma-glutamyl-gamma-aminobutyrate hydrolase family protein [Dellaglioa carnosa]|uniref:Gamma-glutamyl-gamma-aminobutyrate hydrolase family protein n=1 Tax=Dellaglioa carnosa TaxID=2995136 RepID=A0ABT4JK84_9LACO|nr:gamma-glutamyl-gamma-aminobutyrate hydrolase family protein [Dellaglioa carnosa]MCZ2490700.1 gamma-glutamyl-gamma-aminobutyrate hydrolase family protein [Dellaglioa carnosa]MCZ2493778.1 gamma-glutamyl-gamma-aminobutyrate hydrolase family protein [Dellaglioa carnosa]MDK1730642.1 gamma-glutamyl-gamma-aminobutyrate hydrolase family protein [Dellaglioa carnosa]